MALPTLRSLTRPSMHESLRQSYGHTTGGFRMTDMEMRIAAGASGQDARVNLKRIRRRKSPTWSMPMSCFALLEPIAVGLSRRRGARMVQLCLRSQTMGL